MMANKTSSRFRGAGFGLALGLLLSNSCTTVATPGSSVPQVALLIVSDNSLGMVVSQPAGISCSTDCAHLFDVGATVQLTATALADTGAKFIGWEGACTGSDPSCSVTLQTTQQVIAKWQPKAPVVVVPTIPPPVLTSVSPQSVNNNVATAITLTGTGFRAGATVTIGGTACTNVQVVSDVAITCMAAARPTTCSAQPIVITNSDSQTSTLASGFAYAGSAPGFGFATALTSAPNSDHIIAVDLNGDGKLDLVSTSRGSGISVFGGNGDGTFKTMASYLSGTTAIGIAAGDLNGDTYPNLVVGSYNADVVRYLSGDGTGAFAAPVDSGVGTNPLQIAIGDLNGDAKADVVVATNGGDVSIFLGDGTGALVAKTAVAAPDGAGVQGVALGDFDKDGKLDLVFANFDASKFSYRPGKKDGTFGTGVDLTVGDNPLELVAVDLNGDGYLDVATANASGAVSVLLGDGMGGFAAAVNTTTGAGSRGLVVADFNGDKVPDLAVANADGNTVSILINNGDGSFKAARNLAVGLAPFGVAAGDYNGDGLMDLASTNINSSTVSVVLGCK